LRWAIEQCFEETKTELGMDHYEVRKFRGWHQHTLTCMLAHFFLWHLKCVFRRFRPPIPGESGHRFQTIRTTHSDEGDHRFRRFRPGGSSAWIISVLCNWSFLVNGL
jgi:hypothetical protein